MSVAVFHTNLPSNETIIYVLCTRGCAGSYVETRYEGCNQGNSEYHRRRLVMVFGGHSCAYARRSRHAYRTTADETGSGGRKFGLGRRKTGRMV